MVQFNDASKAFWKYVVGSRVGVDEINNDTQLRDIAELTGINGDIMWPGNVDPAGADSSTAAAIDLPGSVLRDKIGSISLGVKSDAFRLSASADGDQTAKLNAFLADATLSGKRRIIGYANINDFVTVPAGVWIDGSQGTIKQNGVKKVILKAQTGSRIEGLTILGRPEDYEEGVVHETSFDTSARAIWVQGDDVTIENVLISGVAHQGVFQSVPLKNTKINGLRVIGVHGMTGASGNPIVILPSDAMNMAIQLYGSRHTIEDVILENLSMGLGMAGVTDLTIKGVRGYNIPGQHLIYLQSGNGLHVSDVVARDVNIECMKVQIHAPTETTDHSGANISKITGINCGGHVVAVTNTDTDLTASAKLMDIQLSGLTGVNVSRISTLINVENALITNVNLRGGSEGINLAGCSDVMISDIRMKDIDYAAVTFNGATGKANTRITVEGADITNPGRLGISRRAAVYINDPGATDITIKNMKAADYNAKMQYAVQVATIGDQETLDLINIKSVGHLNGSVAFLAGKLAGRVRNVTLPFVNSPASLSAGHIGGVDTGSSSAQPINGTYRQGALIFSTTIVAGGTMGWVCTNAGSAYTSIRANSTAYAVGQWIRSSGSAKVLECMVAGTTDVAEPVLPTTIGSTVTDGTVTWKVRNLAAATWKTMPTIAP